MLADNSIKCTVLCASLLFHLRYYNGSLSFLHIKKVKLCQNLLFINFSYADEKNTVEGLVWGVGGGEEDLFPG